MTIDDLVPYQGNARTHSRRQIAQIAGSIERFGFINPVLIDGSNQIIAGHGRIAAAKKLGLTSVPTLRIEHLSEDERRKRPVVTSKAPTTDCLCHQLTAKPSAVPGICGSLARIGCYVGTLWSTLPMLACSRGARSKW
jgi:hypothetical protein